MMHPERKPVSNEPQELDPKVDFTVLDEAVKKVLAYKPKKKPHAQQQKPQVG